MKPSTMKNLPTGWKETADSMKEEELRSVIVESSDNLRTVEREMEEDSNLQKLKEKYKDAKGGYSDAKKAQKAKIDYALHRLEQQGKL